MEIVTQKYNNFLKFILEVDSQNDWVIWLQSIDVTSFLITIKTKNHLTVNEIYDELIIMTKLEQDKLKQNSDKLKRYIEYFLNIVNII